MWFEPVTPVGLAAGFQRQHTWCPCFHCAAFNPGLQETLESLAAGRKELGAMVEACFADTAAGHATTNPPRLVDYNHIGVPPQ